MHIIYHDRRGDFTSVLAAALHLNKLSMLQTPTRRQLQQLYKECKVGSGNLILHGMDEDGNSIYSIGRGNSSLLVTNALRSLFDMAGYYEDDLIFIDTMPSREKLLHFGELSSLSIRLLGMKKSLRYYNTLKVYPLIAQLVKDTKRRIVPD